jgi:hypothetical protein
MATDASIVDIFFPDFNLTSADTQKLPQRYP